MAPVEISIIIATRNREKILKESLNKAIHAITGHNIEIIVVNDGCNELTTTKKAFNGIIFLNSFSKGVTCARNLGASKAKGAILFFIDDDMWIKSEVIKWITSYLIDEKHLKAVYNINWRYPPSLDKKLKGTKIGRYILTTRYNTMWGRMHINETEPAFGLYKYHTIASCSLVLSKSLFNEIGGYNEFITFQGEDIDFSNRLKELSIPLFCVFDVTLYHNHQDRLDIKGYLDRLERGYQSQFRAEKSNLITPSTTTLKISKFSSMIYDLALFSKNFIILILYLIPSHPYFDCLTNRIIGILSGISKYKQWKTFLT